MTEATSSLWRAGAAAPAFSPLSGDLDVDVAIIGAGITGLTAAAHLAAAGRSVAVLEMRTVGAGETGQTTAHLTEAFDTRFSSLIKDFGEEAARLVARSHREAINEIERLARIHGIACDFTRVPGFLYTERQADLDQLSEELAAARQAGVQAEWLNAVPLPYRVAGGIRFLDQARVHPLRYLHGLADALSRAGVRIFEQTRALGVAEDETCRVETDRGVVMARHVIVAANVPVNNRVFTHTFLYPYRSYAIAAPLLAGDLDGLFWDTDDPYHYTRVQEVDGRRMLIVGGEDHKTGTEPETGRCYEALERYVHDRFDVGPIEHRWSGQIIETADGLPCIGRNALESRVFIAGGYSGNGITYGTYAGMLLADLAVGRDHPAAELYKPTRFTPMASAKDYLLENLDFPRYFVLDRLTTHDAEAGTADDVAPGEGRLLLVEGEKLAVYRDDGGVLHTLSPVCTHMACDVRWNSAERSWDCPCHGSRFSPEGRVINGPAVKDLERKEHLAISRPRDRAR
jgi:glycine/D-amino acid oxidase-like deaminating enzyme/nitrite reductase/ring-hydroxylating ferredoxin subunit